MGSRLGITGCWACNTHMLWPQIPIVNHQGYVSKDSFLSEKIVSANCSGNIFPYTKRCDTIQFNITYLFLNTWYVLGTVLSMHTSLIPHHNFLWQKTEGESSYIDQGHPICLIIRISLLISDSPHHSSVNIIFIRYYEKYKDKKARSQQQMTYSVVSHRKREELQLDRQIWIWISAMLWIYWMTLSKLFNLSEPYVPQI